MELDLLIRDARTRLSPGELVNIGIKKGGAIDPIFGI
jgi:hypothetical protein